VVAKRTGPPSIRLRVPGMETNGHTTLRAGALILASFGATVLGAGCGSSESHKNKLKPPEPINVTASVSDKRVSVSPHAFGAGPIVLIITNQTARKQDVTLESDTTSSGKAGIQQSTGPIIPEGGTAQLQVNVSQGTYHLSTADDGVEAATIAVGGSRGTSQNELLQP
jgi:hypothetical protein